MALTQVQSQMLTGNSSTNATNTALGSGALNANPSGTYNTALGFNSGYALTTATSCVAVGRLALSTATVTGNVDGSIAIGQNAARDTTTGLILAVGNGAGILNTTGDANTVVGHGALYYNTTSSYNTAIGRQALANATSGYNTAVGSQAGYQTTGANNTFVGMQAGYSNIAGTGNIIMGYGADVSSASSANEICIGFNTSGAGSNYVAFGKAGNLVYNQFTVNSSWTRSSDQRLKTDIQDDTLGLDFICKVQPRTFKWKPSNEVPQELTRHYSEENNMDLDATMNGFIAQEVKQALDEVGATVQGIWSVESDGTQAVSREMFINPLINAIKELNAKVEAQAAEIEALKAPK